MYAATTKDEGNAADGRFSAAFSYFYLGANRTVFGFFSITLANSATGP